MENKTIGFAVCGSFCTHASAMTALEALKARYAYIIPIVSEITAATDTRFGQAHDLMREMERICDHRVISTIKEAEPIGPQNLLDLLYLMDMNVLYLVMFVFQCKQRCYQYHNMYHHFPYKIIF